MRTACVRTAGNFRWHCADPCQGLRQAGASRVGTPIGCWQPWTRSGHSRGRIPLQRGFPKGARPLAGSRGRAPGLPARRLVTRDARGLTAAMQSARLAVDIGGTFTDLALEHAGGLATLKVLTTPAAPEAGVLEGVAEILRRAGVGPEAIGLVIHGTTLATNAIIERKGARTALVTTQGFRDVLAMGNESRYDQYDLNIVLPEPLVPRHLRLPVPERLDNEGNVLLPLDEDAVAALVPVLRAESGRERRDRLPARLRRSPPRAPRPRHPRGRTARCCLLALGRGLARDARMGALLHHRRQRLRAAADGPLSARAGSGLARGGPRCAAVPDAFRRRADHDRGGVPLSDPPGRERPGRRRAVHRQHRAPMRPRKRGLVRHGRHHGEDLPDRSLRARRPRAASRSPASGGSRRGPACRCASR